MSFLFIFSFSFLSVSAAPASSEFDFSIYDYKLLDTSYSLNSTQAENFNNFLAEFDFEGMQYILFRRPNNTFFLRMVPDMPEFSLINASTGMPFSSSGSYYYFNGSGQFISKLVGNEYPLSPGSGYSVIAMRGYVYTGSSSYLKTYTANLTGSSVDDMVGRYCRVYTQYDSNVSGIISNLTCTAYAEYNLGGRNLKNLTMPVTVTALSFLDYKPVGFNLTFNKQDTIIKELDKVNTTLKDTDTSAAQGDAGGFFGGFSTDFQGLTSVITAPLVFIQSMASGGCNDIALPLGIVEGSLSLPCPRDLYYDVAPQLLSLWQLITDGLIGYWVVRSLFKWVQNFKNPNDSKIEVIDL